MTVYFRLLRNVGVGMPLWLVLFLSPLLLLFAVGALVGVALWFVIKWTWLLSALLIVRLRNRREKTPSL